MRDIDGERSTNAAAVVEQLRSSGTSLPWMAILDKRGLKLVDSDAHGGNIGCPSGSETIDYFIDKMLKPTAQRLTARDLEELRTALAPK